MPDENLPIEPSTKVAALLDHYPQLEDVLIGIAPPFKKLKNPILRKSVARVASLRQAAAVARISVDDLVNQLRVAVGQEAIASKQGGGGDSYFSEQPDWFDSAMIVVSINEETSDPDKMPLTKILHEATRLEPGQIVELITTFLPAPGIDIIKKKGFLVWPLEERPDLIKTYVSKAANK
jgi:hypothetical protein